MGTMVFRLVEAQEFPIRLRMVPQQGTVAQLVEQGTENPCVTGSIPVGTTEVI